MAGCTVPGLHCACSVAPVLQKVVDSKFMPPKAPEIEINEFYQKLSEEVDTAFASLSDM